MVLNKNDNILTLCRINDKFPIDRSINITNNTISIHHFQATWMPKYFVLEKNFWNFFGLKNLKLILRLIYLFKYGTIRSTPPNIRKEKHL